MSRGNVEVVQRILRAWAEGNFRAPIDEFDPNIVLVVRPPFAEPGVFLGPEGIRGYMQGFLAQWERYRIEAKDLREAGDKVLTRVVQHGTGRSSGVEGKMPSFVLFTFRGRRIVRMEFVLDEREALEAAGLSE